MAKSVISRHVSPGIYSKEEVMTYAVKSLGITTLGAVGETQRGPAFQPVEIGDWAEFQSTFGGTNAEKFKGTQYPKYELPYIAKSYLNQSHQLQVVRVLGLSGYNAGPAWAITADRDGENMIIAVLRSRGSYKYIGDQSSVSDCDCRKKLYDNLEYYVGELSTKESGCTTNGYNMSALTLAPYVELDAGGNECDGYQYSSSTGGFSVSLLNAGRFTIQGITGRHDNGYGPNSNDPDFFQYPVSLNPADNDYILKVIGTSPTDGDAPIYVESLYDVALNQGIAEGKITTINQELEGYNAHRISDYCEFEPVNGILTMPETKLSRVHVGKRFLCASSQDEFGNDITCHAYDPTTGKIDVVISYEGDVEKVDYSSAKPVSAGTIYTVRQFTSQSGQRYYFYCASDTLGSGKETLVKNLADGLYYKKDGNTVGYIACNLDDYRSAYRYASTPWIVSNLKGDRNTIEMNKMFRFHTISDGNMANYEVKVSIENILPDEGLFDVVVRDINDSDFSAVVLEKFIKCSMVPGESNYIGYRIGTFDGVYEAKSRFISVEVNDSVPAKNSVPAGFLGYPTPQYDGLEIKEGESSHTGVIAPVIKYNRSFDPDIKNKRQYFGLSDHVGVDIDMFTFKGRTAYVETPDHIGPGFHLDCRLNTESYKDGQEMTIKVDGETGYKFEAVSINSVTNILTEPPIIAKEREMDGSIYEYKNLRKFTVYFYGGFDGWDEYRDSRTNTDEFKMTKYRGQINSKSGEGRTFDKISDPDLLNLNQNGITSDWYAYLAGIRQFANPSNVDINVFVTPGIDMMNNSLLVKEAIDMIEDERADSLYIATMPDKPSGAGDFPDEMLTAEDVTEVLDAFEYDSNYTATYYPWVKYEDTDNSQYIYLPPTKDVVRNLAQTDNAFQPWFAPAGVNRGNIDGVRTKRVLKLADEDELYEHGINPIKTFSSDGTVKVWGQKTIQLADNQLNRIATRRLLLRLRKLIAIATIGLIFDPNDPTTANSLRSAITPILEELRSNRGLSDYKIKIDDSIEMLENYSLGVQIYLKPYSQLEYINLTFTLTPQGVNFDEL